MPTTPWPEDERPRERLLAHGATALSDAELLAIFLRTGTAGMPVMTLARHLIHRFGSLRALMSASHRQFCAVRGLGTAKGIPTMVVAAASFDDVLAIAGFG